MEEFSGDINIYTVNGQKVLYQRIFESSKAQVSQPLSAGVYMIKTTSRNVSHSGIFIVN